MSAPPSKRARPNNEDPSSTKPNPLTQLLVAESLTNPDTGSGGPRPHGLPDGEHESEALMAPRTQQPSTATPPMLPQSKGQQPASQVKAQRSLAVPSNSVAPPPAAAAAAAGTKRKRSPPKPTDIDFRHYYDKAGDMLGWDGRYDKLSDRQEWNKSFDVRARLEKCTTKIADAVLEDNATYATKKSGVTTIRDIIMAILQTTGRMGREIRNDEMIYEEDFLRAMGALSAGELMMLFMEDGGRWVRELDEVIAEAKSYCVFPDLKDVKMLCEATGQD